MNERVLRFGPEKVLSGILTASQTPEKGRGKPTVLLLNAGLLHRVGPYRLYAELARTLAERGFDCLRFDRNGIGESDARPGALSEDERAVADISDAMEALSAETGATGFVLLGLCSGAYHAHMAAAADPRVRGAVFLDGYAYRTAGFHRRQKLDKYLDVGRLGRFLLRKSSSLFATAKPRSDGSAAPPPVEIYEVEAPPFEVFEREIAGMIERSSRLLFIYTGGVSYYNDAGQFREMFPKMNFRGCIETEFYPRSGHTYPVLEDRRILVARLLRWFDQSFGRNVSI